MRSAARLVRGDGRAYENVHIGGCGGVAFARASVADCGRRRVPEGRAKEHPLLQVHGLHTAVRSGGQEAGGTG